MKTFTLGGLLLLVSAQCWAWGEAGHNAICQIAWQEVSAATRAWLTPLYQAKGYTIFAESCNWADHIRNDARFDYLKPRHYVNVPRNSQFYNPQLALCGRDACVTKAITQYRQQLLDGSGDQAQALLLLGHFVGDIHQPLHVSFAEDWGGNKLVVHLPGEAKPSNLHSVWDTWLVAQAGIIDGIAAAKKLDQTITRKDAATWREHLDPDVWAKESFASTLKIYRDQAQGLAVNASYAKRYHNLVLTRLQQAGIRLAAVLEEVTQQRKLNDQATKPN